MSKLKIFFALFFVLICCSTALADGNEWNCPECGSINSGNFCTQCGTKKPDEIIICPTCGEKYSRESGVNFCGNCGTDLRQNISQNGQNTRKTQDIIKKQIFIHKNNNMKTSNIIKNPEAMISTQSSVQEENEQQAQSKPDVRSSEVYEGSGFDTPEDAVTCYLEGLKNFDIEKMLSAFAWETQIKNYSVKKDLARLKTYYFSMTARMPSINDFMFSLNVNSLRSRRIEDIYTAVEAYLMDNPAGWGTPVKFKAEEIDVFLQKFNKEKLEKLSAISNIQFISPDVITENKFSSERNQRNIDREKDRYGADELVNVPAVADIENEKIFCCPTVARYGKKWYIVSFSSIVNNFINIPVQHRAFICSSLDFIKEEN